MTDARDGTGNEQHEPEIPCGVGKQEMAEKRLWRRDKRTQEPA